MSELCVRLDGLPLALELAAARCNLLSPGALLERLGSRLDLLRAAPGSGFAERQWTLRGAIEWSYDLLQPEEQQLFTSLAVFVGGFTLTAAEHVAEQPHLDILEGVETLHRNSLLTTEHAAGDEPRLGMLETIREFALERLVARGDGEAVRRRHAAFYLVWRRRPSRVCSARSNASGSSVSTPSETTSAPRSTGRWMQARRRWA